MADNQYDILVLGGGSAGYSAALRAVQLGYSVALIEKEKLGGTCLHWGCIPTKAYLHSAELAEGARESEKYGIKATLESIDMGAVRDYKNKIVQGKYKGLTGLMKMRKVDVIQGNGKLTGKNTIDVDGTTYTGEHIILATGSVSKTMGLEIGGRVMTSTEALEIDFVPKSARVTLAPLSFCSTFFEKVEQNDNGAKVTLADGKEFEAEIVLVAVGRGPNTADMGFEDQGIPMDRGFVTPNERLHTGVGNIYAIGDIVPGVQLAHRGYQQGRFVAEEIAGLNPVVVPDINVPKVTFTEPEIASVGYSQPKAEEKFGKENVETFEYNLAGNGKSSILGTGGLIKLVREKDGPIVGFHAIGTRISEQIGEGQLMVNWEAYPEDVAAFVHAHPTQNEAIGEAAMALAGSPLHG